VGVSLVSSTALALCVASRVFIVVSSYFVNDSVRKILDTPFYEYPEKNCPSVTFRKKKSKLSI